VTKEDQIRIVTDALTKAYRKLDSLTEDDFGTMEVLHLTTAIQELTYRLALLDDSIDADFDFKPEPPKPENVEPAKPDPVDENTESERPEPDTEPEPADDNADTITFDQVRTAFLNARKKGAVNVTNLLSKFGAKAIQELTPDQYPAVLDELAKASKAGA
jgi:hypothetical protein